jgi:hypothetical protein
MILVIALLFASLGAFDCPAPRSAQNSMNRRETSVKKEVNNLEVEFTIETPKISTNDEFRAKAVFTNKSQKNLRLNALFLGFAPILIKVQTADGKRVDPTSPPFPPEDDEITGREILEPGQSVEFSYRGVDLFGQTLAKGKYQARFRYENTQVKKGDWVGTIETDWIGFEVGDK